jgi:hypothetical protein
LSTKAKTPRAPSMTMAQRFELMAYIKDAPKTTPDRTLAARATENLGHPVSPQTVTNYRKEFGIPSVGMPTREALQEQVDTQADRIQMLVSELSKLHTKLARYEPQPVPTEA